MREKVSLCGNELTRQQRTAFENIVGKGGIARNEQFLLFPQCFQLKQITVSPFAHTIAIMSLFAAELEEPKIGLWGKELNYALHFASNLNDLCTYR